MKTSPRKTLALRITAFAAMFGILLLPLASALHFALVAHHFCATHGVVEHDSAQESDSGLPSGTKPDAPARDRAPADRHESCSQPIQLPVLNGAAPPSPPVVAAFIVLPSNPRVERVLPPVVALLLLAPKTPPPSLA